ncbi:MAG: CysS/YqeB C-terminal domain-containing protein, partial [bacterium]
VTDFALWKFSPEGQQRQMEWDSRWGKGFPGWHIECSAMSVKYLGDLFDIHCGGKDHIPVHHSNEIAQSEACHGTQLANYWLHGYFLETEQDKMSKSSGEFLRLQTLIDKGYDPLAYRYLCLTAHYRSDLKFTWESLDSAVTALNRLRITVHSLGQPGQSDVTWLNSFKQEMARDLNTPKALAVLWGLIKTSLPDSVKKATALSMDQILGLDLTTWLPSEVDIPQSVLELVDQRNAARQNRDWPKADALRDEITALGYEIEDGPDGTRVKQA